LAGIADPVVDALIDRLIAADTRATLVVAARALDRVIRAGRYWVPQWYAASHRVAYWDVFGHPASLPKYGGVGAPDLWWSTESLSSSSAPAK
jgi:microcin C transport system substrate-binding protein